MDTRRLILFVIFSFSLMMLWDAWQRQNVPVPVAAQQSATTQSPAAASNTENITTKAAAPAQFSLGKAQRIQVETDLYQAEIETQGGDLRRLTLKQHRAANKQEGNFVLMDDNAKAQADAMTYIAQSGLSGEHLPNNNAIYNVDATQYKLADGANSQEVRLNWQENGVKVSKIYTFKRGSYLIDVRFEIENGSASAITPTAVYQIVHDSESKQGSAMMPTFTGGAYFTEADKFKKIKFDDMREANLDKPSQNGWIGLIEHYFASAWIPAQGANRNFFTKQLKENLFAVGVNVPSAAIAAGSKATMNAQLFAGPQTEKVLQSAAPGLEYAVDYGWLTIIAKPLFWLLSQIYSLVKNWGVAIILLTVLIKLAFYRLSASSYRSMAQMRELAPRLQAMKEKFGEDRQGMQQAMLELYRKEKINPLGGCLPILVQIPVFIALYWVLLGSVELRHAPFFGWIQDLSAADPWYILPILMGASMIVQTSLSPAPPDPIQAKVMKIMPVAMSVFFFFFPAGLVLYWLVNNLLSIAQQWYINKTIHAEAALKKGSGKR